MVTKTPKYRSNLRERRTADLKRRVVSQMIKIIAEDGLHESAMSKLARRARVSQGSISWHFGSRAALLRDVAFEIVRRLTVPAPSDPNMSRPEKLVAVVDGYILLAKTESEALQAGVPLFSDRELIQRHEAELAERVRQSRREAFSLLEEAMAAGEVRRIPPIVFFGFLLGSLEGIHNRLRHFPPRDHEPIYRELRRAALCALGISDAEPESQTQAPSGI